MNTDPRASEALHPEGRSFDQQLILADNEHEAEALRDVRTETPKRVLDAFAVFIAILIVAGAFGSLYLAAANDHLPPSVDYSDVRSATDGPYDETGVMDAPSSEVGW